MYFFAPKGVYTPWLSSISRLISSYCVTIIRTSSHSSVVRDRGVSDSYSAQFHQIKFRLTTVIRSSTFNALKCTQNEHFQHIKVYPKCSTNFKNTYLKTAWSKTSWKTTLLLNLATSSRLSVLGTRWRDSDFRRIYIFFAYKLG